MILKVGFGRNVFMVKKNLTNRTLTEKLQNMICHYVILTDKATDNDFSSSWVNAGGKM